MATAATTPARQVGHQAGRRGARPGNASGAPHAATLRDTRPLALNHPAAQGGAGTARAALGRKHPADRMRTRRRMTRDEPTRAVAARPRRQRTTKAQKREPLSWLLAVSAAFGAWLRRQREARGWSRSELACRMADAAGSAVTAPAHVLETYLSRWEAGHVAISARYRQLLDAVLGPGASAPAEHPVSVPPDPRKWVRAMRAIESGIADGQWKPGDRLPARPALAQRYGLTADAVMRAQDELLRAGALRTGQVYGALYVSDAQDQQPPGAPLPAASGPDVRGGCRAVSPPARAAGGGAGDAPPSARNPRAYARPDTRVPAVPAGSRSSRGCRDGAGRGARPGSGRCG